MIFKLLLGVQRDIDFMFSYTARKFKMEPEDMFLPVEHRDPSDQILSDRIDFFFMEKRNLFEKKTASKNSSLHRQAAFFRRRH